MFKLLAVFLAIVAFSEGLWSDADLECIQELNLNINEMAEFENFHELPTDNENLIKLEECVFIKRHYFDANGDINFDAFEQRAQELMLPSDTRLEMYEIFAEELSQAIEECSSQSFEGVKGVIAIKVKNCIFKYMNADWFGKY